MSLNIKNEETCRLAEELAALTKENKTQAITIALRERLERETAPPGGKSGGYYGHWQARRCAYMKPRPVRQRRFGDFSLRWRVRRAEMIIDTSAICAISVPASRMPDTTQKLSSNADVVSDVSRHSSGILNGR